jgi:DNA polymerase-3 subunit gamma/tau
VSYQPSVLPLVVRAGAGSARDALSVLDQLIAGSGDEGLVYDKTVALLGYSDDSLLDAMVDAFATGDGGAAFGTVDQVVQSGHDPRRFAADLLDRLRDLIILAAVPGAGKAGLLDAPVDRLERMSGQAERFGQAELARAAEILSDGLIQMRGTTSPRLLLELVCAQVLLPGSGTGERALLARLERLEHRLAGTAGAVAGAGAAAPRAEDAGEDPAQQPRREPPRKEQARPSQPASGQAEPARTAPPGRSRSGSEQPRVGQDSGQAQADRPDTSQRQPAPPAQTTQRSRAAGAPVDMNVLRGRWTEILEAVRGERRVAWMLLRSATVQSLESGVFTVGFAREGEAKGFSTSGCDQVLAGALNSVLGINVRVRAMVAAEAAVPSARPASSAARGSAQVTTSQAPASDKPAPTSGPSPSGASGTSAEHAAHPGGARKPDNGPRSNASEAEVAEAEAPQSGPKPSEVASGAPQGQSSPDGEKTASGGARAKRRPADTPAAGRANRKGSASGGRAGGKRAQQRQAPAAPGDSSFADEEWPDDAGEHGAPATGPDTLTGMELIQRQLGGKVIEEIEDT